MRTGELLDRTFATLRQHFLLFAALVSLPLIAAVLLPLPFLPHDVQSNPPVVTSPLSFLLVLGLGFGLILFPATMGATASAVAGLTLGERPTIHEAWRKSTRRIPGLLVTTMLIYLALAGAGIVFVAPFALLGIVNRLPPTASQVALVVGLILTIAAVGFVIWVAVGLSLAQLLVVLEDTGPLTALRRSWLLVKGGRWRIFFVYLFYFVVDIVFKFLCNLPVALLTAVSMRHGGSPFWLLITSNWVGILSSTLLVPLLGIGLTLEYFNQRIQKEAFDLQIMMSRPASLSGASYGSHDPIANPEVLADGQ